MCFGGAFRSPAGLVRVLKLRLFEILKLKAKTIKANSESEKNANWPPKPFRKDLKATWSGMS